MVSAKEMEGGVEEVRARVEVEEEEEEAAAATLAAMMAARRSK